MNSDTDSVELNMLITTLAGLSPVQNRTLIQGAVGIEGTRLQLKSGARGRAEQRLPDDAPTEGFKASDEPVAQQLAPNYDSLPAAFFQGGSLQQHN